ncbi:MAG: hypothetical protein AAFR52_02255 [Pseudomonadota bacterium]
MAFVSDLAATKGPAASAAMAPSPKHLKSVLFRAYAGIRAGRRSALALAAEPVLCDPSRAKAVVNRLFDRHFSAL